MGRSGKRGPGALGLGKYLRQEKKQYFGELAKYLGDAGKKIQVTRPSDLGEFARSVLGLWHMGILEPREIAGVLWVQEQARDREFHARAWQKLQGRVEHFLKLVYKLKHPVTEYILDHGLPRGCGAVLPEGKVVHCPSCGCLLSSVPCVLCTDPALEDRTLVSCPGQYERFEFDDEEGLPVPKYHTDFPPGSIEKIEVMRGRARRGESCFHYQDRPLVIGADKQGFWG